jgi:hypothetical protein
MHFQRFLLENGLSKKMTASIIFNYQYEMITEDEISEEHSMNNAYYDGK